MQEVPAGLREAREAGACARAVESHVPHGVVRGPRHASLPPAAVPTCRAPPAGPCGALLAVPVLRAPVAPRPSIVVRTSIY